MVLDIPRMSRVRPCELELERDGRLVDHGPSVPRLPNAAGPARRGLAQAASARLASCPGGAVLLAANKRCASDGAGQATREVQRPRGPCRW